MNIYNSLYELIVSYVFGGVVDVGSVQELAVTLCSLFGTVSLIAMPFIFIFWVIKGLF